MYSILFIKFDRKLKTKKILLNLNVVVLSDTYYYDDTKTKTSITVFELYCISS